MTYYIGSARHDENGKYAGGKRGDQTGQEVATQKMYNYFSKGGWMCCRPNKGLHAMRIKQNMLRACANDNIGYSMSDRYGIMRTGTDTTKPTNTDCSTLVRKCIEEATGKDVGDFTTANESAVLEKSGLFKNIGKVTTLSKLYDGDILVTARKGHTAIVTSGISRGFIEQATDSTSKNIHCGITYANSFTGHDISLSINKGAELKRQRVRVLQHALNLDYKAKLEEDGIYGPKTAKALGSHYVRYGETQYMVSAAEILYYLIGADPNGYEVPGIYGKGLKKASGKNRITAKDFKSLL